jgi:hypothetical protein
VYGFELRKLDGETGMVDTFDFLDGADGSSARVLGVVNGRLVVGADVDEDGDGVADRVAMLVSNGEPASVADFTIVDDGSGTFSPQSLLFVSEIDQLVL